MTQWTFPWLVIQHYNMSHFQSSAEEILCFLYKFGGNSGRDHRRSFEELWGQLLL